MSTQLSSIPTDIKRYSGDVADYIDKNVEKASGLLRETLSKTPWIPESMRPKPPPPEPPVIYLPTSAYEKVQDWVSRHKILTGVIVLATGTVLYRTYRSTRFARKTRKAKRARSGGRLEVVVVAGSPSLPLTRSLALDLERKGFVVFVVCNSIEDEMMTQNMARPDIRPLTIDITDVSLPFFHLPLLAKPNFSIAAQRWLSNRAFRTLPPGSSQSCSRRQSKSPHPQISHPHTVSQLPDFPDSHDPAVEFCRFVQYAPSASNPHYSSLPSSPHGTSWYISREDAAKGPRLHAIHYLFHQPTLPRP